LIQCDGIAKKIILAAALLCGWAPASFSASAQPEGGAKALSAVVRLEIIPDNFSFAPELLAPAGAGPASSPFEKELRRRLEQGAGGSAFCVAPGYFLTASHIVLAGARYRQFPFDSQQWQLLESALLAGSKPRITLYLSSGKLDLPARVVSLDREDDLALIYCPGAADKLFSLPLAEPAQLQIGLPVISAGYGEDGFHISRGEILSLIRGENALAPGRILSSPGNKQTPLVVGAETGGIVRIQHSAPTEAGMSGGPILNDNGEVLGIAYGVLSAKPDDLPGDPVKLYLAIAGPRIIRFLATSLPPPSSPAASQPPAVGEGDLPQGPTSPPPASASGNEELAELAFRIRTQNARAAIPYLQVRLRLNRTDFAARALLVQAHYQESLYPAQKNENLQAAFYQASWLSIFAPELEYARPAQKFIAGLEAAAFPAITDPGTAGLVVARTSRKELLDSLRQGLAGPGLTAKLTDLGEELKRLQTRSSRRDPAATAALVSNYLDREQAEELSDPLQTDPLSREHRRDLLQKALALSAPLASQLGSCPGTHRLLALIYLRQAGLQDYLENQAKAKRELDEAFRLDPTSPSLRTALEQLPNSE
jgi:S1-C subfamily serine protease